MTKRTVGNIADAATALDASEAVRGFTSKGEMLLGGRAQYLGSGTTRTALLINNIVYKVTRHADRDDVNEGEVEARLSRSLSRFGWYLPARTLYTVGSRKVVAMPHIVGVHPSENDFHMHCNGERTRWDTCADENCKVRYAYDALGARAGIWDMFCSNYVMPFASQDEAVEAVRRRGFAHTPKIVIDAAA